MVEEELFFVEIGANDGKFADPLYAHVTTKVCVMSPLSLSLSLSLPPSLSLSLSRDHKGVCHVSTKALLLGGLKSCMN